MNSSNSPNKKKASLPPEQEKAVNRYVFTCIGMILYIIPCLSCLGIGIASEGSFTPPFLLAFAVELLSIPVGLMGIYAMKKKPLLRWKNLLAAVTLVLHVLCAVTLGVWYVIMAPTFLLLALNIAWSSSVKNLP